MRMVNFCLCFSFAVHRGDKVGVVDVLCYRDYTREGKRVNSHSLYVKGIKLSKMSTTGTYML